MTPSDASDALGLAAELRPIFGQDYPRFSIDEMRRRHDALGAVMAAAGVDHLVIVTIQGVGNATLWATGWRGTTEALTLFRPGERMAMWVEYYNHLPLARQLARDVDVRWGEEKGISLLAEELRRRGAKRVGVIGPLAGPAWKALEQTAALVPLNAEYIRLRSIKSEEEIRWMRLGAALSDAGMRALVAETRPGMSEHELANIIERAYVGLGGTTGIHFIGSTPMAEPDVFVPRQFTSRRRIAAGDFVFCELSAAWWDYSGQILRGFAVEAEPSPLYRELHAVAETAFGAITKAIRPGAAVTDLIAASGVIEKAGYTTCDDLVHGYGGGYFQPILGTSSRPAGHPPKGVLEANMCLVVQPNVITRDERAGVQLGECIRVTASGFERLHALPLAMFRSGDRL